MAKKNEKKNNLVTFYKPRHLASVIWDPKKDKPLIQFDQNLTFTTDNPKEIELLKKMGYTTKPPVIQTGEASGFVPTSELGAQPIQDDEDIDLTGDDDGEGTGDNDQNI